MTGLGRLARVDLRATWADEARDFTPWLAESENLAVLSEALGLGCDGLELEAVERFVGPYRADILCRRTDDGAWALIENQLEATDHRHLGQVVTYAAGLDARLVVWIAARVTEEHRAAVDWLNRIAGEDGPSFFALEVGLWRIGDSPPAPRFDVVASPNDWSRQASGGKVVLAEGDLSETRRLQLDYWSEVCAKVQAEAPFRAVSPLSYPFIAHSIGRAGMTLNLVMSTRARSVRCEIYLTRRFAKQVFRHLRGVQAEIEERFGNALEWEENPGKQDCRIAAHLPDADPTDREDWPRQHRWLVDTASRMHDAFRPVIAAMPRDLPADPEPPA